MGNIPALKSAIVDPHNHDKIKTAFNSYDLDRNGYLTRSEFGTFATNLMTILETGPYGPELKKALGIKSPKQFAEAMFDTADMNSDNKISFAEFQALIAQQNH